MSPNPLPSTEPAAQRSHGQVFESKLNPPAASAMQVLRGAICDLICSGWAPLVLVRAPAGFGKTTAMMQGHARLQASGIATAWLTLDSADNDTSRFLNCLGQAVLRLGVEPAHNAVLDAVQAVKVFDAPFALFLDDFETVHEPAVLGLVREIIDHLPRHGRLIIGSRSLPALGLARLRARGQLIEIDAELLRFNLQDTTTFFGLRRPLQLTSDMLAQLHHKTEGWIAALWLAAMALERHGNRADFIARFSGSERAVADYLAEDVLAHQPPEIRAFLLRTSILRQLDASVCVALNPRVDCARMLDYLDGANLFLTPVSGEQRTWRFHSLFANYLRAQLEREQPDEVARLNLAASGWYESVHRPVPAIDHAIEGGDYPYAMELLEKHAEQFLEQGRMRLLTRWFSCMPAPLLRQHPLLQVCAIWAAAFTRGPWEAMELLEQSGCAASADPQVRANVAALRPLLLAMQDRSEEAFEIGRQSLAHLPTGKPFVDSVLQNAMSHIFWVMGDKHEAQRMLDAARRGQGQRSTFNRMYTESMEGMLDLVEGRLRQATASFRMAVDATHAVTYNHTHGNAWAGVLYACVVYESNQLDKADHLLNVYLPLARDVGLPDHMILCHMMRSRIAFIAGDVDAALLALTELEYLGHQRKLPRVVASAKLERARLLLRQGNSAGSRDEMMRADDPALWQRERSQRLLAHDIEYLALARLRWEVTFGDTGATVPLLEQEIKAAMQAGRHRRLLTLRLLHALALQRSGQSAAAVAQIGGVLQVASQEGFMRQLLDEGPGVGALVRRYHAAAPEPGGMRDAILTDYLQRLLQNFGALASDADTAPELPDGMLEPLTRKELRVLQLLAEGFSNGAMAEKLFVSDSTVRTHLRNINMKLGATSRTQAVAVARKLGVIR